MFLLCQRLILIRDLGGKSSLEIFEYFSTSVSKWKNEILNFNKMHVLILVLFYCKTYSRTRISYSKKWWKFHVLEKGFSIERKKKKKGKKASRTQRVPPPFDSKPNGPGEKEWMDEGGCASGTCFFFSLRRPLSLLYRRTHSFCPPRILDPKLAAFPAIALFSLSPRGPPQKTTYYANYTRCCAQQSSLSSHSDPLIRPR